MKKQNEDKPREIKRTTFLTSVQDDEKQEMPSVKYLTKKESTKKTAN